MIIEDVLYRLGNVIKKVALADINDENFIEKEIREWKGSVERSNMITGEQYYKGIHDILRKKRQMIGTDGKLEEISNLPNSKIVDNQYAKMVDQKTNYLVGKPLTIQCENKTYQKLLTEIFDIEFNAQFLKLGRNALNAGKSWIQPYYDENGNFKFKIIRSYELKCNWKDDEHTVLDYAIRIYPILEINGTNEKYKEKVDVYTEDGICHFDLTPGGKLIPRNQFKESYFLLNESEPFNWNKIPLVCFKYHDNELPLIAKLKSLQDGINQIESTFTDNMQEDARYTILVLVNYDGENLAEFRRNLATYGAVKVRSDVGGNGDLKSLQVQVNSENYKVILKLFKDAIVENAMGYDAKDDRLSGNPNQVNIKSMYNDIDMDANNMETEFQLALHKLLWFVNCHLMNTGHGDFFDEKVDFIFNRDTIMNESEVINDCIKLKGILSDDTIIAQIPWVKDIEKEKELLRKQQESEYNPFEVDNDRQQILEGQSDTAGKADTSE